MNRLILPVILTATIVVAASFAFMPVQRATTTHLPSVAAGSIADGSVTTAKLADGALSADAAGRLKMADGFVDSAEILDNSVASGDILLDTIVAADIAPDAVAASELASVSLYKLVQLADGTSGWVPDAILLTFTVLDVDVTANSVIVLTMDDGDVAGGSCVVSNLTAGASFVIRCGAAIPNGAALRYLLMNP